MYIFTKGQITLSGFDKNICIDSMTNVYTYSNWSSTQSPSGSNAGYTIYKNGISIYGQGGFQQCYDLIFINDSVGFSIIWYGFNYYIKKTSNYGISWTNMGVSFSPGTYLGTYVINEHSLYFVTVSNLTTKVTCFSDTMQSYNLILDTNVNAPVFVFDSNFVTNCYIDNKLRIFINNNSDTVTYYVNYNLPTSIDVVSNTATSLFKIYPNPTSNMLNIDYGQNKFEKANIFDLTGKLMISVSGSLSTINISELPKGIYFINLINENKMIFTKKFVKQ